MQMSKLVVMETDKLILSIGFFGDIFMKLRWLILLGVNGINSLNMAFLLVTMCTNNPHVVTLIEPNSFIITGEAIFSVLIVVVTFAMFAWSLLRNQ